MPHMYFTLTAGRTGSAWLAHFLGQTLGQPAVHEPLSIDDFGVHMPDIRLMRWFNSRGLDAEVRRFWQQKLADLPEDRDYIETNHTLSKCGLVEALADHPRRKDAKIIILKRDLARQCASYLMRHDFTNITTIWQWYLSSDYANIIVNPELFSGLGASGQVLWYAHEMECRQIYYQRKFGDALTFVEADLETVTQPQGAADLLDQLEITMPAVLPPRPMPTACRLHPNWWRTFAGSCPCLSLMRKTQ